MMRYQRVSPDILPLSNGRKPALRTFKEDKSDHGGGGGGRIPTYTNFEPAKALKGRSVSGSANDSTDHDHLFTPVSFSSPSVSPAVAHSENQPAPLPLSAPVTVAPERTTTLVHNNKHHEANGLSHGSIDTYGGHVLLQWGQHKRSRRSRTESRPSSASKVGIGGHESSPSQSRQPARIQRRSAIAAAEKVSAVAAAASVAMPPPCGGSYTRGANLRPCTALRDATGPLFNNSRTVDERSSGPARPEKRSPPSAPEKTHKATAAHATPNGSGVTTAADGSIAAARPDSKQPSGDQETCGGGGSAANAGSTGEKLNLDRFEWPRIYISLSRKEKEDDFLIMKGTKLPQRPKKRAKNIDKTLQYCFPGMWLSDLTRSRYEVREKKCLKKRRRGLKGMESMDSDSE